MSTTTVDVGAIVLADAVLHELLERFTRTQEKRFTRVEVATFRYGTVSGFMITVWSANDDVAPVRVSFGQEPSGMDLIVYEDVDYLGQPPHRIKPVYWRHDFRDAAGAAAKMMQRISTKFRKPQSVRRTA